MNAEQKFDRIVKDALISRFEEELFVQVSAVRSLADFEERAGAYGTLVAHAVLDDGSHRYCYAFPKTRENQKLAQFYLYVKGLGRGWGLTQAQLNMEKVPKSRAKYLNPHLRTKFWEDVKRKRDPE